MSTVLIVGDGPLAEDLIDLSLAAGHDVVEYLHHEQAPDIEPVADFELFLEAMFEEPIDIYNGDVHVDDVDLAIEAVVFSRPAKWDTVSSLDVYLDPNVPIFTTVLNGSTTDTSRFVEYPERLAGWATLPPVEDAGVIEVTGGVLTADETLAAAMAFFKSLGKEAVQIEDRCGGVLPRVVVSLVNEAAYAVMERVATPEDIDRAMQLGTNYPHGPLEWGDRIGLDQIFGVLTALGEVYGQARYRPAPLVRQYVYAGRWGRRTGRGFYRYET